MPRRALSFAPAVLLALTACVDEPPPAEDTPDAVTRDMRALPVDLALRDASPDLALDAAPDLALDLGCVPAPERCDGIDDDCDGITDEQPAGERDPCDFAQPGVCGIGTRTCVDGAWQCEQAFFVSIEQCDEADNDCDGRVDEQLGGDACDTGAPGRCAAGVRQCAAGQLRCMASLQAIAEACTGADQDCDGAIDEDDGTGNPCVGCIDAVPDVQNTPLCGGGGPVDQNAVGVCADGPELHIIGHYEPTAARTPVRITRVGVPLVLVLSSYEPTTWALELDERVDLAQVIVNGYEPSVVDGLPDGIVPVDRTRPGNYLAACAYAWPGDDGGCDTPGLVLGAEGLTGLTLTSFQACYSGASFAVGTRPR